MPAKMYDWDTWFRSKRFTMRRGEDYDCTQSAIVQQIRNAANRRGKLVSIVDSETSVTILVSDPAVAT